MDIKIQNGKILSTGTHISEKKAKIIDLEGKYVAPGIVDPHVHLGLFTPFDTEIVTETRSALLNGVTTIGLYLGGQESYLNTLDEMIKKIETRGYTDVFIHLVILTRAQLEEIPLYYSRYGITSYKTYMCGIPGLIPAVEDDFLMDLMEQVASLGDKAVLNIHAENHRVVNRATERLKKTDPAPVSLKKWEESHPGFAEAEAIQRASYLSKETGAKIYFVHMSSGESIRMAEELKRRYRHIFFETTSPYLTLSMEEDTSFLYKMTPPVRTKDDQQVLWEGLAEDVVDTIGTDHTPMSVDEKKPTQNLWDIVPGYPAVGTHLPSLLDSAIKRRFPLTKLIEKMTANPAKIFGLYPQKGTILPGSDADLIMIDPHLEQVVTPETSASRSDYCLHEGKTLTGWPVGVIKSGTIITKPCFDQVKGLIKSRYLRRAG
jgi:dihydropyrimidinase